jgi:hypothetical protein
VRPFVNNITASRVAFSSRCCLPITSRLSPHGFPIDSLIVASTNYNSFARFWGSNVILVESLHNTIQATILIKAPRKRPNNGWLRPVVRQSGTVVLSAISLAKEINHAQS